MNKIKAAIRKFQSGITISMNKRPLVMTILILIIVNLLILFISAIAAAIVAPEIYPNVIEAFANGSLRWMISSTSINSISGNYQLMLVAGATVVIEIVLFSGTIIALTTNGLKTYFTKKAQAKGKLILEDHIVILNWNSKVTEILNDLIFKGEKLTALVLSDKDKEYVHNQLDSALMASEEKTKNKLNLIVRQGDPFLRSDLEDICITDARSILIMASENLGFKEEETNTLSPVDLNALKLLLLAGSFKVRENCNIVLEVESKETVNILADLNRTVASLYGKRISSFSFNRKLGQIIAQTVFQPKLAAVYVDLLSFRGDEFYSTDYCDIPKYLAEYTESIPIINYDKLFVLTEDASLLNKKRETPYHTDRRLKKAVIKPEDKLDLYIIGQNKKSKYMLENLERVDNPERLKIHSYGKNQIDELMKDICADTNHKEILILSDDSVPEVSYDANVFYTLIQLNNIFYKNSNLSYITEILDPRNAKSVENFNVHNSIVSNRLISLFMAQLATNTDSLRFYEELLLLNKAGEEGFDLKIFNVEDMLDINQNLQFISKAELLNSFYFSFGGQYMLIGIIKDGKTIYLSKDMDKEAGFALIKGDQLIMMQYA